MVVKDRELRHGLLQNDTVCKKLLRDVDKKLSCETITSKVAGPKHWGCVHAENFRSMLGGRDVKYDTRLDVMSATPPPEIFRCLCSMCARRQMEPELFSLAVIDSCKCILATHQSGYCSSSGSPQRTQSQEM